MKQNRKPREITYSSYKGTDERSSDCANCLELKEHTIKVSIEDLDNWNNLMIHTQGRKNLSLATLILWFNTKL
jgi:hypothetical protein